MISAVVMTHPSRSLVGRALAHHLGGVAVTDPEPDEPGAWSCARLAWGAHAKPGTTHRLVVQDDALPCEDFIRRASDALSDQPGAMVAFYVGSAHASARRLRMESMSCSPWHELARGHFVPTVALAMPLNIGWDLAAWPGADQLDPRYDDEIVGAFRDAYDVPAWATIPCLVEHDNRPPSLLHPEHGHRTSCCPLGTYKGVSRWAT